MIFVPGLPIKLDQEIFTLPHLGLFHLLVSCHKTKNTQPANIATW